MHRTTTATFPTTAPGASHPWWPLGLAAAAVAAALNAVLFALYQFVTGAPLHVPYFTGGPPQSLPVAVVILTTAIPVLLATLLAAGLNRWLRSGRPWFIGISLVVALASLVGPLTIPATSVGNDATLAAMHLIAGAVATVALAPRFRTTSD